MRTISLRSAQDGGGDEDDWWMKLFSVAYELEDGKAALDLLRKILTLPPNKRLSAEECLEHEYFKLGGRWRNLS